MTDRASVSDGPVALGHPRRSTLYWYAGGAPEPGDVLRTLYGRGPKTGEPTGTHRLILQCRLLPITAEDDALRRVRYRLEVVSVAPGTIPPDMTVLDVVPGK